MKKIYLIVLYAAVYPALVFAQAVHKVDKSTLQLVVKRDVEGFSNCGIRMIAVEDRNSFSSFYDFTVSAILIDGKAVGYIEGGRLILNQAQQVSFKEGRYKPQAGPSPDDFSLAKNTDAKPLTLLKTFPDPKGIGALFAVAPLLPTVTQIVNLSQGSRMHLMLKYPGEQSRIVEMSAALDEEDTKVLGTCLKDVTIRGLPEKVEKE